MSNERYPKKQKNKEVVSTSMTVVVSSGWFSKLKDPPFQRPYVENAKVRGLIKEMRENDGMVPGVITLGEMSGELYLLDGQHRRQAFLQSSMSEGLADVRTVQFKTMADMGREFSRINDSLRRFSPDDRLRALELSSPGLALLKQRCPFVGYGSPGSSSCVSASAAIRSWRRSEKDTVSAGGGPPVHDLLDNFTLEDAGRMADFLEMGFRAWSNDREFRALWSGLNLTIVAWIYRRVVLAPKVTRAVHLTPKAFEDCMAGLTASAPYLRFAKGRHLNDLSRSPTYKRIVAVFVRVCVDAGMKKPAFPKPIWVK